MLRLGRDADAGIPDAETDQNLRVGFFNDTAAQFDLALFGKFHRVAGEIEKGLLQTNRIAAEFCGQITGIDR